MMVLLDALFRPTFIQRQTSAAIALLPSGSLLPSSRSRDSSVVRTYVYTTGTNRISISNNSNNNNCLIQLCSWYCQTEVEGSFRQLHHRSYVQKGNNYNTISSRPPHRRSSSSSTNDESNNNSTNNPHPFPPVTINPDATCPYEVLNIPKNSDDATVKKSFIQAALVYHPDRGQSGGDSTLFIRIREAFEEIIGFSNNINNPGTVTNDSRNRKDRSNNTNKTTSTPRRPKGGWSNRSEFDKWLEHELTIANQEFVGFQMDQKTRQEVINVYRTSVQSGHDRGGYWEMARLITERDEIRRRLYGGGGGGENNLNNNKTTSSSETSSLSGLLSAGTTTERESSIISRRKRRR